ncbi:hypothetical protein TRFO_42044 [Tritrichomonas foetus]|uniref:Uncharacterized protein n=1 Tax=Tritrichomonas foetus TaxID=1144522 RepID=A0A1J4L2D0_9EUKA|nr:hypothetical protein TRFO_42044 [Tritrichomonas foetus]|eukprot:OHT16094.1 hypothetical protein TRFO_42044 [Tritrichomonas foetus]
MNQSFCKRFLVVDHLDNTNHMNLLRSFKLASNPQQKNIKWNELKNIKIDEMENLCLSLNIPIKTLTNYTSFFLTKFENPFLPILYKESDICIYFYTLDTLQELFRLIENNAFDDDQKVHFFINYELLGISEKNPKEIQKFFKRFDKFLHEILNTYKNRGPFIYFQHSSFIEKEKIHYLHVIEINNLHLSDKSKEFKYVFDLKFKPAKAYVISYQYNTKNAEITQPCFNKIKNSYMFEGTFESKKNNLNQSAFLVCSI